MATTSTSPSLLYLTIYNPTLQPLASCVSDEDEDAEEQAHILFYTSRERAVARDKMLRQVGLAKAMVAFSELFSEGEKFDNAHSQTRRLVTISPEPDFWMHAGIELARTPRTQKEPSSRKARDKITGKETGKTHYKGKAGPQGHVVCDPVESSVHDLVVRSDLFRAYETFKLRHGSFSSILSKLGREALELQLERFFTVWAWSWDLEDRRDFGSHLGTPTHPFYTKLLPTLDNWTTSMPPGTATIVLEPPHVLPSTRYVHGRYPAALARHLLFLIPSALVPAPQASRNAPISQLNPTSPTLDQSQHPEEEDKDTPSRSRRNTMPGPTTKSGGTFLGIPNVHMNFNMQAMDVRKWNWPGYMSFGKGTMEKPVGSDVDKTAVKDVVEEADGKCQSAGMSNGNGQQLSANVEIDTTSLTDAISSDDIRNQHVPLDGARTPLDEPDSLNAPSVTLDPEGSSALPNTRALPLPSFSTTSVFLADGDDAIRSEVFYITSHELTLALVGKDIMEEGLNVKAIELLKDIRDYIQDQTRIQASNPALPSAARILQPQDKHIVSRGGFTFSSEGFRSTSEHLFNAQQTQERESDILEVFSRGQNPQHWHVAKRGLGQERDIDGDVYLEVARKETSLTDVDNMLAGLVKGFME